LNAKFVSILCLSGLGVSLRRRGSKSLQRKRHCDDAGHNPKLCHVASAQAQKAKAKKEEKKFLAASSFTKRLFDTSKFSLESQLSMSQCNDFELLPAY